MVNVKGLAACLTAVASFASADSAHDVERAVVASARTDDSLYARAFQNAPDGYVPKSVKCPSNRPEIRNGSSLSQEEIDWTKKRRAETVPYIRDLLKRIDIPDFDSEAYLKDAEKDNASLPNIGLAFSGGGYRALLNGAGAFAAWDIRSAENDGKGNLGGLLQSSTYVSGLSGGSWLVGSLYVNNFTTVQASLNSLSIWQFQQSILEGPEQYSLRKYFTSIVEEVSDKKDAGYERSITDYWGRMLSYQLFNVSEGGPGLTFSSIAEGDDFKDGKMPLPFVIAVGRAPDEKIISTNSTVFTFNPWEFGSYDPSIGGFAPLEYVGSNFTDGKVPKDGECVRGFDNAGFVLGTSSSLFNQISKYLKDDTNNYVPEDVPNFITDIVVDLLDDLGDENDDIADWTPNPFLGWNAGKKGDDDSARINLSADSKRLTLVDGGEDNQNIPYYPHIRTEREVDVVFSIDSSADTEYYWPDGASPIATYERSLNSISNGSSFPAIPGKQTFINLGLNARPTFFGCNATNTTTPSPLIVYIPNYPYVYNSNISTFQLSTNVSERDAVIENGWAVATQLNATRDEDWPVCVGCAMLARSFERTNETVPEACKKCFENYCWNGTLDEREHDNYDPQLFTEPIDVQDGVARVVAGGAMTVAAVVAMLLAF